MNAATTTNTATGTGSTLTTATTMQEHHAAACERAGVIMHVLIKIKTVDFSTETRSERNDNNMSDKTAAELVREWISNHVHPSLEGWVEVYLDDPELDDDMRDIDRWHVDQIEEFIVNTLEPMTDNNGGDGAPLDSCGSLEQALCLNGEDAGWFFSQLLEFFYMEDDEYEEHKRKRHADGGGAAALYNGEL